jgi:hypothetical protein
VSPPFSRRFSLLPDSGRVLSSCYASSPIGRTDPEEAINLVKILAKRKG